MFFLVGKVLLLMDGFFEMPLEPKGNEFQNKMLRWLPVWSICTMLEPLTQIRDSRSVI
ncbi:hypothetical protein Goshw_017168 [Gossypium schwendimanii]|uniref:Uncharacterized protein n=1 Tax=Gossypium schwendimanii TaxID=34291 RepID=A0A7J9KSP4_GOSSC|nr:hypothetical protein [Gossypium schwendimanii]